MSKPTKSPPNLLSLPNELLAEICIHARDGDKTKSRGKEWLRAVRLTCKQLHVPATIEFGKRFLATVPVMVARGSLETLVEICEHRLIGPRVSEIQLYCGRASRYHLDPQQTDLKACVKNKDLHRARHIRHRLRLIRDFYEDELELEKCAGIFQHLENALKIIRDHGRSVNLSIFTKDSVKPLGYKRVIEQLTETKDAELHYVYYNDSVQSTLHVLLVAAVRSGCLVDGLKILGSGPPYEEDKIFPWKNTACREALLSTIKVLHVELNYYDFSRRFVDVLEPVLQQTKNLVEFSLNIENLTEAYIHSEEVDLCTRAICSIQSRSLRKIELEEVGCRQRDILTLLGKNKDTLENITLKWVTLLGSWSVVMMWIRDHCSLKFMSVCSLYDEFEENATGHWQQDYNNSRVDDGFGARDESGDLSHLDEFLEQKRKEQARLEGGD
jgi:hypothetical protein